MSNRLALAQALAELKHNQEQYDAAHMQTHCVVLAGPGSGKTKTLTTAMARTLVEDVVDPRGVACITYNNECVVELETRLAKFGVMSSGRSFTGTVHSFALTQVIMPYARCIAGPFPNNFRTAQKSDCRAAVEAAYDVVFGDGGDPHGRWHFAEEKRRRVVDRSQPAWREETPVLADFIEAYEAELRIRELIDFDDMPLIAYRMVKENRWIRDALRARFPVLFVDEYQDLGHALHELVLLLCFEGGIRLFAVGDADQSIYSFTGANPRLLQSLTEQSDVKTIRLRINYRSGGKIIRASLGALGEERDYCCVEGTPDGELTFCPIEGNLNLQAQYIVKKVLPTLLNRGFQAEQIAILYRAAWLGDRVAEALKDSDTAFVRTDSNALLKRSSSLARFIEACASWVTGGWCNAAPPFSQLLNQARVLVYGSRVTETEEQVLSCQLMTFLKSGIDRCETTYNWLARFYHELIKPWRASARNSFQEWDVCLEILRQVDPEKGLDMPLNIFSGRAVGTGRVTLSTFHSVKGREFDAVILFGINKGNIPSSLDQKTERALHEARRLFYVGVTRPRKELLLVFQKGQPSPWVKELYLRAK